MRDPSPTNHSRPTLAALLLVGLVTACGKQGEAPSAVAAAGVAAASAPKAAPAPDPDEVRLERWRRSGDLVALTELWRAQVASNDAAKWEPLLQSTAFGITRLRGGKVPAELREALAAFASSEGIAQHRRIDPRLVLPVAELLWDQRDAAAVLRLAATFGKPPHEQGYRFLRSAADEVASKQPATMTVTGSCSIVLDGAAVEAGKPTSTAPGSHTVGCAGAAARVVRLGPGEAANITLP